MIDGSVLQSAQRCFEKKSRVVVKMVVIDVSRNKMAWFWCLRPLTGNRAVHWIQVHFKENMGRKFWDLSWCPLNMGSPQYRFQVNLILLEQSSEFQISSNHPAICCSMQLKLKIGVMGTFFWPKQKLMLLFSNRKKKTLI